MTIRTRCYRGSRAELKSLRSRTEWIWEEFRFWNMSKRNQDSGL